MVIRDPRRGAGQQDVRQAGLGPAEATEGGASVRPKIPMPGDLFGKSITGVVAVTIRYRNRITTETSDLNFTIGA